MITKRRRHLAIIVAAVIVSLLATWLVAGPALASLGNRGVPVYGRLSGSVPQGEERFINFYAADGSLASDTIPDNKYLLITDIAFTPDGATDAAAVVSLDLEVEGTGQNFRLRSSDNSTHSLHFTTPIMVAEGGRRVRVTNAWYSEKWVFVHVAGMLVDNVTYIPVVVQN